MDTPEYALIGNAKAGTISTLSIETDALRAVTHSEVGQGCGTFAVDRARDLVYSAVKEPTPAVVTLRLDRASGELTEIARREISDSVAYLELAHDGRVLLGASYGGGWGVAWPVADGSLGDPPSRVEYDNLHAVITDRAGGFAYFVSLGDDLIVQVRLGADASFEPLDPPTVSVAPGAGARHLVLSENERCAYLMTEFTGEAIRFDRDPGTGHLSIAEALIAYDADRGLSVSRYGADPLEEHLIWGADLHLAAEGRYLVCTERTISTLAVISLDADGRLERLLRVSPTEQQPRGFNVTPDGNHLVVAGEVSGHASLYRIGADGGIEALDRMPTGAGANWVRFA